MTDEETKKVKKFVAEYVLKHGRASSREIADAVYDNLGISVSHVTIQSVLHDLGFIATRWMKEAE